MHSFFIRHRRGKDVARAVTAVTRTASALLGTKQSLHVTLGAGGRERERERIYIFGGKQLIDRIGPRGGPC